MRASGFTLVELLVAVAIMALISAVAMPIYTQYSLRSFRTAAQADLMGCGQALERFASINFNYLNTADTDDDGVADANNGVISRGICDLDSVSQGRYDVTVVGTQIGFVLTAAPLGTGRMDGDGDMTFDSIGNRTWDTDDNGTVIASEQNWIE